jgi:hypothetical protein
MGYECRTRELSIVTVTRWPATHLRLVVTGNASQSKVLGLIVQFCFNSSQQLWPGFRSNELHLVNLSEPPSDLGIYGKLIARVPAVLIVLPRLFLN